MAKNDLSQDFPIRIHASIATSIDGYVNDTSPGRLILSSQEDLADVYLRRSHCDAIFVGAGTLRTDNPSLILHDSKLIESRVASGRSPQLIKVTATLSGRLEPHLKFFQVGDCPKWVICPEEKLAHLQQDLHPWVSEWISVPRVNLTAKRMVQELAKRGLGSVFFEGGPSLLTRFLEEECLDTLRLAIAPILVGVPEAPRVVRSGKFRFDEGNRMRLEKITQMGDTAVLDYHLKGY